MSSVYSSTTVSGYNSNPPPDDGTTGANNKITWSGIKSKLSDPINTYAAAQNTALTTAFGKTLDGAGTATSAVDYPAGASDQGRLIIVTVSGKVVTTPDATVVLSPFVFGVINRSNGNITITGNNPGVAQTVDGSTSQTLQAGQGCIIQTDGANWFTFGRVVVSGALSGITAPTAQRLTSGSSATYTPTAGTVRIRVRMVGSGGGGGARITNFGSGGGTTTFGSWTALGGSGGSSAGGSGGAGGTGGFNGTGTLIYRVDGNDGAAGGQTSVANVLMAGGVGGNSLLGSGAAVNNGTGATARANSGGGGQGAGGSGTNAASGGGSGEYVEFWVNNPAATTYTITAGGAGGAAGTLAGGAGGSGFILVDEYYQ